MKNEYDVKDSGLIFILSLFVPSLVVLFIMTIIQAVVPDIDKSVYNYISVSINQVGFFLIFFLYSKARKVDAKESAGIKFNLNIKQILVIICIGLVCMYGFSSLVNYMDWGVRELGYNPEDSAFNFLSFSNFGMLIVNIVLFALLPAICEELVFRGTIMNGLKKYGTTLMIVLSGLLFCIMHLSIEQSIYQFVLGMVLASVSMITGSVVASMILHFFNNALVLALNFISPTTDSVLWQPTCTWDHIAPFVFAIVSLVLIFGLLLLLKKCTKNVKYDIFSFKRKPKYAKIEQSNILQESKQNDNQENVNQAELSQIEGQAQQQNDINPIKHKKLGLDDIIFIASVVFGALLWVIAVLPNFFK